MQWSKCSSFIHELKRSKLIKSFTSSDYTSWSKLSFCWNLSVNICTVFWRSLSTDGTFSGEPSRLVKRCLCCTHSIQHIWGEKSFPVSVTKYIHKIMFFTRKTKSLSTFRQYQCPSIHHLQQQNKNKKTHSCCKLWSLIRIHSLCQFIPDPEIHQFGENRSVDGVLASDNKNTLMMDAMMVE